MWFKTKKKINQKQSLVDELSRCMNVWPVSDRAMQVIKELSAEWASKNYPAEKMPLEGYFQTCRYFESGDIEFKITKKRKKK